MKINHEAVDFPSPVADDAVGLRWLASERPRQFHRGVVLYLGQEVVPLAGRLHAVPVSALWRHSAAAVREPAARPRRKARPDG